MKKTSIETEELINHLLEEVDRQKDTVVIVEGKKDVAALKALGFQKIIRLDSSLYKIIERVDEKRVIILTDLDAEGCKIYSVLKKSFSGRGVFVDDKIRDMLFQTELRQIEGLTTYLKNLKKQNSLKQH